MTPLPLTHSDISRLKVHPFQASAKASLLKSECYARMVKDGMAWSIWDDGHPVVCAGLVLGGLGSVMQAWVLFDEGIGPAKFLPATRMIRQYIDQIQAAGVHRIEAVVRVDFPKAVRWAKVMGFEREGKCRRWDGRNDYYLYARLADA